MSSRFFQSLHLTPQTPRPHQWASCLTCTALCDHRQRGVSEWGYTKHVSMIVCVFSGKWWQTISPCFSSYQHMPKITPTGSSILFHLKHYICVTTNSLSVVTHCMVYSADSVFFPAFIYVSELWSSGFHHWCYDIIHLVPLVLAS